MFMETKHKIKMILSEVHFLCTTTDIWTSRSSKSYLGMTAHWINAENQRQSAIVACRRLKGSHTHDKIAAAIAEIHSDFGIPVSKVVCTVTDNAKNFEKAFSTYSASTEDDDE